MARRHYSDFATPTTLSAPITSPTQTTCQVAALSGYPAATPWTAVIDSDQVSEELVLVTNVSGTTLTITRNFDGSGAFTHLVNASFGHVAFASDYDEANAHINASTGVHGITGAVVGTTDAQTLSNKTIVNFTAQSVGGTPGVVVGTDTDASHTLRVNDHTGAEKAYVTGAGAVHAADVQTATLETTGAVAVGGALTIGGRALNQGVSLGQVVITTGIGVSNGFNAEGAGVTFTLTEQRNVRVTVDETFTPGSAAASSYCVKLGAKTGNTTGTPTLSGSATYGWMGASLAGTPVSVSNSYVFTLAAGQWTVFALAGLNSGGSPGFDQRIGYRIDAVDVGPA